MVAREAKETCSPVRLSASVEVAVLIPFAPHYLVITIGILVAFAKRPHCSNHNARATLINVIKLPRFPSSQGNEIQNALRNERDRNIYFVRTSRRTHVRTADLFLRRRAVYGVR